MTSPIEEACLRHELRIRKHVAKMEIETKCLPCVLSLDGEEKRILREQGAAELDRRLRSKGCFAFPALDISKIRPRVLHTDLGRDNESNVVLVSPREGPWKAFGKEFNRRLMALTGIRLSVVDEREFELGRDDRGALILGGGHENQVAKALSHQNVSYGDRNIPGKDGFLIHTIHDYKRSGRNLILIAGDESAHEEMLRELVGALGNHGQSWTLNRIHAARPGKGLRRELGSKTRMLKSIVRTANFLSRIPEREIGTTCSEVAEQLRILLQSGGVENKFFNGKTIPAAVHVFHAYQVTGDREFLKLLKDFLWALVEYHIGTDAGVSNINTYDFHLGPLITAWSLVETDPLFDDDERLIITNVLLSSLRQIRLYKACCWKTEPNKLRFNHETFPALNLYWGARYFGDYYRIPEAEEWDDIAEEMFTGPIGEVFKHMENANHYQWYVPCHKFSHDAATGRMESVANGNFRKAAYCAAAAIDNFGNRVDYGDTSNPLSDARASLVILREAASAHGDGTLSWVEKRARESRAYNSFVSFPYGSVGLAGQHLQKASVPPNTRVWERLDLDDHVRRRYAPLMPRKYTLDKIGFRTGWGEEDQFLLFEPYAADMHIHYDMNAILRYNHKGRIWIVDNGYGKPSGVKNATEAYARRQTGPSDHNTVIFWRDDDEPVIPPPFCAILSLESHEDLHLFQSALLDVEGSDWLRSVVILENEFLLVIDQINIGGSHSAVECQFNGLGELEEERDGWILEQTGKRLFVTTENNHERQSSSYLSATWEHELIPEIYPHAKPPVKQLSRISRNPRHGARPLFATLVAATSGDTAPYRMEVTGSEIRIEGDCGAKLELERVGLVAKKGPNGLYLNMDADWRVPEDLTPDMFGGPGEKRPWIKELR